MQPGPRSSCPSARAEDGRYTSSDRRPSRSGATSLPRTSSMMLAVLVAWRGHAAPVPACVRSASSLATAGLVGRRPPQAWFGILEGWPSTPFILWTVVLGLALLTSRTLTCPALIPITQTVANHQEQSLADSVWRYRLPAVLLSLHALFTGPAPGAQSGRMCSRGRPGPGDGPSACGVVCPLAQPRVERARPAWREPVNHGKVVRAVLAVTILVISVVFALTESPRLGLDLRGGTQITLETRDSLAVKADRGVHRMDPGGAAPSCRRARCRRTGYRPVR